MPGYQNGRGGFPNGGVGYGGSNYANSGNKWVVVADNSVVMAALIEMATSTMV